MPIFKRPSIKADGKSKKREMPDGLWQKCPGCGEVVHTFKLEENFLVCTECDHHFTQSARARIAMLMDPGSFHETNASMVSVDVLKFKGMASYADRLRNYKDKTGLNDAVLTGHGAIEGISTGIAVMDFNFLAATMGSVVGEKITRTIEDSTARKMPVVIVSASGGARMYEGMLSLMQMAKTAGALARHAKAGLSYISVLTNPTTAGVMASYASLGDVILAEPKCMIGFAGPRVIRETTHQELPPGFQTAEFLLDHGLVDRIVPRKQMRDELASLLRYMSGNRKK